MRGLRPLCGVCPEDAVQPANDEANDILNKKIAEYTLAVLQGRPHFHISLVASVSPYCDCHAENDIPVVPDVGMFASFDPVALDVACADAVNRQPICEGSALSRVEHTGRLFYRSSSLDQLAYWHRARGQAGIRQ